MAASNDGSGALRTARVIALAMAAGVTMFAALTGLVHGRTPPEPSELSSTLTLLWPLLATVVLAAAIVVWRMRVAPPIERARTGRDASPGPLLSGLIMVWALVEAAALAGVVVYFLFGTTWTGAAGVAAMWIAIAFTWPRAEWFGQRP